MTIWYLFLVTAGLILLIVVGQRMSSNMRDWVEVLLFWIMYITTILCVVVIGLSVTFFNILRNKKGQPGKRGEIGDKGERGDTGDCEVGCRDKICTKTILDSIINEVNRLEGNPTPPIELKNAYIKEKVKQICNSDEFKQIAPYRGPNALISYLKDKWIEWTKMIYDSAGKQYFQSIGAENEFEWEKDNPFNEIKKYDIFYWGLGEYYRPKVVNRCIKNSDVEASLDGDDGYPSVKNDNKYKGDGWKYPDDYKKNIARRDNIKYSVFNYTNLVSEGIIKHKHFRNNMMKIKAVSREKANLYTIRKKNPDTNKYDYCISVDKNGTITDNNQCNSNKNEQHFIVEFMSGNGNELRLKHKVNGKYLKQQPLARNSRSTVDSLVTNPELEVENNGNGKDYTIFILE